MRRTYRAASTILVGAVLLGGCGASAGDGAADPGASPSATEGAAETWDAPDDYEFVLHSRCGERNDLGRYAIVVEGGEVTEVDAPHWARVGRERGRLGFTSDYAGEAPTLTELMAEAEAAEAAGADVVELTTDPEDGRPTRLDIDWREDALDDEACFIVSDYRCTGAAGCGTSTETASVPAGDLRAALPTDVSDLEVFDGPRELAAAVELVVRGQVTSVADGPRILGEPRPPSGRARRLAAPYREMGGATGDHDIATALAVTHRTGGLPVAAPAGQGARLASRPGVWGLPTPSGDTVVLAVMLAYGRARDP